MDTGVALLTFGEPETADRDVVVDYLTRIFLNNASLSDADDEEAALDRSRELAERRAPGLIEEYESIGGSPLNAQSAAHADALADELDARGYAVETYVGTQFTEPSIADAAEAARADGVDRLVGLPVYPLCGPSTTVAALDDLDAAVAAADGWTPELDRITGWHRHPRYVRLRADTVARFVDERGVDLAAPGTALLFSAHGTPVHYLEEGSRYDRYVEEFCATLAAILGVEDYELGYQNHENRDVDWTGPDVEAVVAELDTERVVVEPVSFMHEQSETLSELDEELREECEAAGLEFHRVPVPHDDPRFASVLADLVEPFVAGFDPEHYQLRPCQCAESGAYCLNS